MTMSVIIVLGPCLLTAMSALALFIVQRGFSRNWHALLWAAANLVGAGQWGLMAAQGLLGWPPLRTGLAVDVLALLAILLFTAGFGVRATGRVPRLEPVAGGIAFLLLLLLFAVPIGPARAALTPALSVILLVRAALRVMPRRERVSATVGVVVATLLVTAAIHAAAAVAALAEQAGLLHNHLLYLALYIYTVEPSAAAAALSTLMLIAVDFAAERRRLVHTDPLTGVLNRQGFEEAVRIALDRGRARPLAVALADIDRFKQVNDGFGHQVGDQALMRVAAHLSAALGRDGVVARLGGEEFALLLPGLDGTGALGRVELLRRGLSTVKLAEHPGLHLSASFGVAQYLSGDDLGAVIERADVALYRSKRDGRDRSTLAAPAAESAAR